MGRAEVQAWRQGTDMDKGGMGAQHFLGYMMLV